VGPVDRGGVEDGRAGEGSWGSEMKNEAVLVLMGWGGGSAQRKRSEGESLRSFSARRRVAAGSGAIAASGWCVAAIQVLAGAACESCGFYSTSSYLLCFSVSVCFIVLSSIAVHPLLLTRNHSSRFLRCQRGSGAGRWKVGSLPNVCQQQRPLAQLTRVALYLHGTAKSGMDGRSSCRPTHHVRLERHHSSAAWR
jgi:hypothetical protein